MDLNANDLINQLKKTHYKKGYKLEDREDIYLTYQTLNKLGLPLDNLIRRLQTLTIIKDTTTDAKASGYNPKTNTITYIDEEDILHELNHVASSKEGSLTSGIVVMEDDERRNVALNEGVADLFNTKKIHYPFELLMADALMYMFGTDIFKGYFNNSYDEFIMSIPEISRVDTIDLIANLDDYHNTIIEAEEFGELEEYQEDLRDISNMVISILFDICNTTNIDKNDLREFLKSKCNSVNMISINDYLGLEDSIDSVVSKSM